MTRQHFQDLCGNNGVRRESQERNPKSDSATYTWIPSSVNGMELPASILPVQRSSRLLWVFSQTSQPRTEVPDKRWNLNPHVSISLFIHRHRLPWARQQVFWKLWGCQQLNFHLGEGIPQRAEAGKKSQHWRETANPPVREWKSLFPPQQSYIPLTCQPRTCLTYNSEVCSIHKRASGIRTSCWDVFRESQPSGRFCWLDPCAAQAVINHRWW